MLMSQADGMMPLITCSIQPHQPMRFTRCFCLYSRIPWLSAMHTWRTGNPEQNGIPDVLDEARWGLDWLLKMNPGP